MRVDGVEVIPFAIPLRVPLATGRGTIAVRRGFLVAVQAGRAGGIGEASPHPAAPAEALAATSAALAQARAWLVGADAARLEELLRESARLEPAAAAGIDMALHDLLGRLTGRTVTELLGGAARRVVTASALLAGAAVPPPGFTCAKVKVDRDVEASLERLAAVRAAAPSLALRADANGCYDAEGAIAAARRFGPLGLEWLEQPVPACDMTGMVRVRRDGGVAIAADETVTGPEVVAVLAAAAAADAVVLKLVQVGGLARARETARAAAAAGLAVTVTTAIDTGVGTAAALHLAAALPGPLRACGLATGHLLAGDVVTAPIPEGPLMVPPAGPGLGVTLDRAALARWRA